MTDLFSNLYGQLVPTYPLQAGFKRQGTSAMAAASVKAGTLQGQVLAVLEQQDLTADEIADELGIDRLSIRPRLSELLALGKITETSERRPNKSGRLASVWRASA